MKDFLVGWIAALFGVIVGVLLMASECRAAPLTPVQARDIYVVAYGQCPAIMPKGEGCPPEWLQEMPTIHIVSGEKLCELAIGKPKCPVRGMYQSGTVYILDTLDFETVWATSILLHEYIHHFQILKNGPAYDCASWVAYETEAYTIQAQVLAKAGDYMMARSVMLSLRQLPRCTEQ